MTHEVVDFRKPGRVSEDISHMLSQWQQRVREALELLWGRCVPSEVKIAPQSPAPLTGSELRELAGQSIVYRIDLKQTGHATLFLLDRRMALALVKEVFGDAPEELPEDRPLTPIETTCLDYLIDELRRALEAGQNLSPRRHLVNQGQARLKELHTEFPENVTNTDVRFQVSLPYASEMVRWVLPQDVTLDFVAASTHGQAANEQTQAELERLVLGAPGELVVRLGDTRVSLSKLAQLKPGDVIVLDQRIEEPLMAELGGQQLFVGWGGRIGRQQAFQVDTVLESAQDPS